MSAPEYRPWLLPFLYAESEEHDRVEDCPGAVGEISRAHISIAILRTLGWKHSQHTKRLIPMQIMLNINCSLRLHRKTDQAHH